MSVMISRGGEYPHTTGYHVGRKTCGYFIERIAVSLDWMVGAGLDPAAYYASSSDRDSLRDLLNMAAYDAMYKVQEDYLNFTCAVLSGTGRCTGNAWHPTEHPGVLPRTGQIAVLPDASVRWLDVMVAAADADMAIIVEVGGGGAHLVSLGRERDLRIVRVPHATTLYKDRWSVLTVDCDKGMVSIEPP